MRSFGLRMVRVFYWVLIQKVIVSLLILFEKGAPRILDIVSCGFLYCSQNVFKFVRLCMIYISISFWISVLTGCDVTERQ